MQDNNQDKEQEKTLSELLTPYIIRWYWIAVGVIVFVACAFIYLRYATPAYQTTTKILIKDEKRGQSPADLNVFQDLGIMSASGNIDNEIEILRSRTLQRRVADSLELDISYFTTGRIKTRELYKDVPIKAYLYDEVGNYKGYWRVELNDDGQFVIVDETSDYTTTVLPGELFQSPCGSMFITLLDVDGKFPVWIKFGHWNPDGKIAINSINKFSGVVDMSMISSCPRKSEDILNTLVYFYNRNAIEDKRWVTEQTIEFLDIRLRVIAEELEKVEKDVEGYKRSNQLTDLQAEAGIYLSSGSEYEKRISEIELQKVVLESIEQYVANDTNRYSAIPTNLGISDVSLLALIEQYNQMQLARRESAVSMTSENPVLIEIDRQIAFVRNDIMKGIRNAEKNYDSTLASLRSKEDVYMSRIRNLSTNEREFRGFVRQKELTESIYMYLLQKREESAITLSMVTPNARVVDPAYTSPLPVQPKRPIVLLAALILGLLVPVGIIYLIELLNNKIKTKDDLEKLVKAPVLGIVPEITSDSEIVIKEGDRSGEVEMYRLLSTNLEFMLTDADQKVIMVTSSVPSEGKSSFSLNLALTWATVGKKVLLIDLDMRNSRMKDIFDITTNIGMSTYLSGKALAKEVIFPSGEEINMDIAPSGTFPPNPVQLLLSKKLQEFLAEVKPKYDIIVIDTPPVLLVTDALLINQYADATVYVTRSGITHKQYLRIPEDLYRTNKLKKLSYVIKGIGIGRKYGYGYGYGYGSYGVQPNKHKAKKNILGRKKR